MNDATFLRLAYAEALKSPDKSTQNGALLVPAGGCEPIGAGTNGPPEGVHISTKRLTERPLKYRVINHAEEAACFDAVRHGKGDQVAGATLYCPWALCSKCACVLIALKVARVVAHKPLVEQVYARWSAEVALGGQLLAEAGIKFDRLDGPLDAPSIRFGGRYWDPAYLELSGA